MNVKFNLFKKVIKNLPLKINKLFAYNKDIYNILLKIKLLNKKQIILGGCARAYFSYLIGRKKNFNKNILFYFIDDNAGKPDVFFKYIKEDKKITSITKNINIKKINIDILNVLHKLSMKYKDINFTIKSKNGYSTNQLKKLIKNYPETNLKFILGGEGYNLLNYNNFIIGLNSTSILEAYIANKECVVPKFGNLSKKKYQDFFHYYKKGLIINSKNTLKKKIISFIENDNKTKKDNNIDHKMIKMYLGDIKKTPNKLKNFIENN